MGVKVIELHDACKKVHTSELPPGVEYNFRKSYRLTLSPTHTEILWIIQSFEKLW